MTDVAVMTFSGLLDVNRLDISEDHARNIALDLNRAADQIRLELAAEVSELVSGPVTASISFRHGSLIWEGSIQITAGAWPTMEAMATVGGAIGLIQLVRDAVTRILTRWFARFGLHSLIPAPQDTRVVIRSIAKFPSLSQASRIEEFISLKQALLWITLVNTVLL